MWITQILAETTDFRWKPQKAAEPAENRRLAFVPLQRGPTEEKGYPAFFRNARLFIILFVRNFWRVCSQFWLSVRNSVWGPFNRNSRGNPSFCWLGGGGLRGTKIVNKYFVNKLAFPIFLQSEIG